MTGGARYAGADGADGADKDLFFESEGTGSSTDPLMHTITCTIRGGSTLHRGTAPHYTRVGTTRSSHTDASHLRY